MWIIKFLLKCIWWVWLTLFIASTRNLSFCFMTFSKELIACWTNGQHTLLQHQFGKCIYTKRYFFMLASLLFQPMWQKWWGIVLMKKNDILKKILKINISKILSHLIFRYFNSKLTIPMPRSKSIMIKIYILPLQKSWNSLIASWTKCGVINVVCLSIIIWRCKWMSIQIRHSTKLCKSASLTLWRGSVAISVRMYYVCETYHAGCILLSSHLLCRSTLVIFLK